MELTSLVEATDTAADEEEEISVPTPTHQFKRVYTKRSTAGLWHLEMGAYRWMVIRCKDGWRINGGVVLPDDDSTLALQFCEVEAFEQKRLGHYSDHFRDTLRFLRWGIDAGLPKVSARTRGELVAVICDAMKRHRLPL